MAYQLVRQYMLRQFKNNTKQLETNLSSFDLDKSNIISIRQFRLWSRPASGATFNKGQICLYKSAAYHSPSVSVSVSASVCTVLRCCRDRSALRKKDAKGIFLTPLQTSHWKWGCLRGRWSANWHRLS